MTICLDFDGVLHKYSNGYQDGEIYDPPTDGMVGAVKAILAAEAAFVLTARRNLEDVADWLRGAGLPAVAPKLGDEHVPNVRFWNSRNILLVTNRKLPARHYVDDRAVLFAGDWNATLATLGIERPEPEECDVAGDIIAAVRVLHPQDELGFCATCVGAFNAYDGEYVRHLWPCPTLLALSRAAAGR